MRLIKVPRQRQRLKRHSLVKSEFALFQTCSRLSQVAKLVKCRRIQNHIQKLSSEGEKLIIVMLSFVLFLHEGDVTQDDSQPRFLAQPSITTLLRQCFECF